MRTKRSLLLILLAATPALVGGACADEPTRDESGEITETEDVDPNTLQAGDCFNDPEAENTTRVEELQAVPCDEPHDNEVFHVFDLDDGDFPGADEVKELGLAGCEPELEAYVGATAEEAGLAVVPVTPTEDSWNDLDDRTVICALYNADASKLTGSIEGRGAGTEGTGEAGTEPEEPAAGIEETEDTSAE